MERLSFSELGRVYCPINIKPLEGTVMLPVQFKIDTGADKTTISKANLSLLGYDMEWIKQNAVIFKEEEKPTTASGEKVNAGYVQLPLINILGYEGKSWPFQIIIDENQDFRNLLGRDLLTGFNYCVDNDNDIFTISKAKIFKPCFGFLSGQEIHEVA